MKFSLVRGTKFWYGEAGRVRGGRRLKMKNKRDIDDWGVWAMLMHGTREEFARMFYRCVAMKMAFYFGELVACYDGSAVRAVERFVNEEPFH